jgi:hypothetical protein
VSVIDVTANNALCTFQPENKVVYIGWTDGDSNIICFSRDFSSFSVHAADTCSKIDSRFGHFENIRVMPFP